MDKFLGKKYKLKTSENFEEYMKYIGIGFISRKTVMAVSPIIILKQYEDGTYTYACNTSLRNVVIAFRLGEEFIEQRPDGVKVKSIFTIEGNKLIQVQIEDNGRKSMHVREYVDDCVIVTTTVNGWDGKSIRTYELVR